MSSTMPMRADGELFEAARTTGVTMSRSAQQQFNHWARIGRELEAAPELSIRDVQRVLRGIGSYDDIGVREQAVVRAAWDERIERMREDLNLQAEFTQAGRTWTEADENGHAVARGNGTGA